MDYQICGLALQLNPQEIASRGMSIVTDTVSLKILQQKVAAMKFYVDWIRVDMEEDGA